jgi:hypothetical protein
MRNPSVKPYKNKYDNQEYIDATKMQDSPEVGPSLPDWTALD